MIIIELLNPKSDYVFKRIFGYTGNEEITKNFLQAITNEKIENIELDCNPITEKNLLDDKVGILDIKAKEVLEEISQDKNERYLAELRDKYIRDQKAIEGAGYDKGVKAGTLDIAKKMKDKNINIKDIIEITGLSEDEIKNL